MNIFNKMKIEIIERDLIPGNIYVFNDTAVWKYMGIHDGQITLLDPDTNRNFFYQTNPNRVWTYDPSFKFGR